MNAYLNYISYYLPEKSLSNENIAAQFPEWEVDKIADKIGVKTRKIAAEDEFVSDMSIKAANSLIEESNIDKSTIDFIILCTQNPDYKLPTTACILQHKIGLGTHTGAIDINLGCSGYIYGIALAKSLIVSGIAKKVLFITADVYSKIIAPEDKSNLTIFGDAATASIISADKIGFKINDFELGTDGSGFEKLILKNGGAAHPVLNKSADDYLHMNGADIFAFTNKAVPVMVSNILEKSALKEDDISYYIFHQANKFMLNSIRKKMNIPEEKFIVDMEDTGNTVSSTIPIVIKRCLKKNIFKPQQQILIAGFGVGLSWGANILTYE